MEKLFNSETAYIEAREKTNAIIDDIASEWVALNKQYREISQRNDNEFVYGMAAGTRVKTAKVIIKANIDKRNRYIENLFCKLDLIDLQLKELREAKAQANREERYRREGVKAMAADLIAHFNG